MRTIRMLTYSQLTYAEILAHTELSSNERETILMLRFNKLFPDVGKPSDITWEKFFYKNITKYETVDINIGKGLTRLTENYIYNHKTGLLINRKTYQTIDIDNNVFDKNLVIDIVEQNHIAYLHMENNAIYTYNIITGDISLHVDKCDDGILIFAGKVVYGLNGAYIYSDEHKHVTFHHRNAIEDAVPGLIHNENDKYLCLLATNTYAVDHIYIFDTNFNMLLNVYSNEGNMYIMDEYLITQSFKAKPSSILNIKTQEFREASKKLRIASIDMRNNIFVRLDKTSIDILYLDLSPGHEDEYLLLNVGENYYSAEVSKDGKLYVVYPYLNQIRIYNIALMSELVPYNLMMMHI